PADGVVTIEIYDILGRKVDVLAKDEFRKAGSYQVMWDASKFSTGVYFYRLESGNFVETKKMVLIK
ncbi:MAG TPA: T9SS type A sorting domain-containing protein, partial [Ignavibacteria bacterium]|nr:T9SS type A sorting domain-containing protein [Ignavibacteria bacterium]